MLRACVVSAAVQHTCMVHPRRPAQAPTWTLLVPRSIQLPTRSPFSSALQCERGGGTNASGTTAAGCRAPACLHARNSASLAPSLDPAPH
jgi:hypothetical protein